MKKSTNLWNTKCVYHDNFKIGFNPCHRMVRFVIQNNSETIRIDLFMYRVSMLSHLLGLKFLIFLLHYSLLIHSMLLIPLSHSSSYCLHQRISRSSFSSSTRWTPSQKLLIIMMIIITITVRKVIVYSSSMTCHLI